MRRVAPPATACPPTACPPARLPRPTAGLRAAGSAPAAVCSLPHVGARRRRPLRVRDSSAQPLVAEPANGTTNGASGDAAAAPLGQAAAIPSPAAPAPAEPQAVRVVNAVLPMQGILLPPDVYQQVTRVSAAAQFCFWCVGHSHCVRCMHTRHLSSFPLPACPRYRLRPLAK